MWLERRWIVVAALSRDFLPGSWGGYTATVVDALCFVGSVGFFLVGLFLFLRWFPAVGIADWWEERLLRENQQEKSEAEATWFQHRLVELGGVRMGKPKAFVEPPSQSKAEQSQVAEPPQVGRAVLSAPEGNLPASGNQIKAQRSNPNSNPGRKGG